MATDIPTIHVPPDSEIGQQLQHAAESGQRVRIAAGDTTYEVDVLVVSEQTSEAPQTDSRSGIERAAGGWVGLIDFDAFLEDHYARRRMVGRPPVNFDQ